jgi:hypothetical protein
MQIIQFVAYPCAFGALKILQSICEVTQSFHSFVCTYKIFKNGWADFQEI